MRIVIGYDDSECARAALADLDLAGLPPDAEALVLAVVDAFLPPEGERADAALPRLPEIRAAVRDAMRSQYDAAATAAADLRKRFPGWTVHAEACADSPAWALVKRAEGIEGGVGGARADLVVVGSHGKSGLQRLVLGSVSSKVLAHVRCSVRIARPRAAEAGDAPPRLVVGADGSPDARAAVAAVAARRWPPGTRVRVAAFEPPGDAFFASALSAESAAAEAADALRGAGLAVDSLVERGDPKRGLVECAERFGAGGAHAIFVGASGVRGIERFLIGSVSSRVASAAHCSVEVVRARRDAGA